MGLDKGAVSSPHLFYIYVDELISRLKQKQSGCWIGPYYSVTICYANDIMLLSPSISGLKDMISICETYAYDFGMTFNSAKPMCMKFGYNASSQPLVIKLDSCEIKWETTIKHLGNHIQ